MNLFKISRDTVIPLVCAVSLAAAAPTQAAETAAPEKSPGTTASLFGDKIIVKGKGVEIRSGQLEEAFLSLKANKAANGQDIPIDAEPDVEKQLLERMIA
ncbi:MAG: Peptidylprolyl isomerase, partial [Verrucomicrobiales bacterium]|nr:Peptidylprolyl isomerase [Verrucomicrobiales bacterium]